MALIGQISRGFCCFSVLKGTVCVPWPQNKNGFCGDVPVSRACLAFITLESIPREFRRVSVCVCLCWAEQILTMTKRMMTELRMT